MATSTYLSNPVITINAVDLSDVHWSDRSTALIVITGFDR